MASEHVSQNGEASLHGTLIEEVARLPLVFGVPRE